MVGLHVQAVIRAPYKCGTTLAHIPTKLAARRCSGSGKPMAKRHGTSKFGNSRLSLEMNWGHDIKFASWQCDEAYFED